MIFTDGFHVSVKGISIAHEFIIDGAHSCEYPLGRGSYGLVYALGGQAEYRFFDGGRILVTPGDLLFLSKSAAYSIITEDTFHHYTVNFDIYEEDSRLRELDRPYCLLNKKSAEMLPLAFKKLVGIWSGKGFCFEMQGAAVLYELLALFYTEYVSLSGTFTSRLQPAKEYIERNFNTPISLDELARLSNMSVTNFRREWKRIYSDSPLKYRDGIRLYYAREYLSSGYYTVSEIAEKCGFTDASYFVRFFKRKTGKTPGRIKKQVLGE